MKPTYFPAMIPGALLHCSKYLLSRSAMPFSEARGLAMLLKVQKATSRAARRGKAILDPMSTQSMCIY